MERNYLDDFVVITTLFLTEYIPYNHIDATNTTAMNPKIVFNARLSVHFQYQVGERLTAHYILILGVNGFHENWNFG